MVLVPSLVGHVNAAATLLVGDGDGEAVGVAVGFVRPGVEPPPPPPPQPANNDTQMTKASNAR
jgi:hypothetical protein